LAVLEEALVVLLPLKIKGVKIPMTHPSPLLQMLRLISKIYKEIKRLHKEMRLQQLLNQLLNLQLDQVQKELLL